MVISTWKPESSRTELAHGQRGFSAFLEAVKKIHESETIVINIDGKVSPSQVGELIEAINAELGDNYRI